MVSKQQYYNANVHKIAPQEVEFLFKLLGTKGKILDVGCGKGDLGAHAPEGVKMYGIDHDDVAKTLLGYVSARVFDIEKEKSVPYKNLDGAILKDVLEHLDDPLAALQKVLRSLKQGGRVLITVPNANPKNVWNDYTHRRGFTKGAVRMLCEDAGLTVVRLRRAGGIPGCGMLKLYGLAHFLVNLPLIGATRGTGWLVVCEKP